jgi:hypothetical protein
LAVKRDKKPPQKACVKLFEGVPLVPSIYLNVVQTFSLKYRGAAHRLQLGSHLEPVLRARDFAEFDLDRAFEMVSTMAARVRGTV